MRSAWKSDRTSACNCESFKRLQIDQIAFFHFPSRRFSYLSRNEESDKRLRLLDGDRMFNVLLHERKQQRPKAFHFVEARSLSNRLLRYRTTSHKRINKRKEVITLGLFLLFLSSRTVVVVQEFGQLAQSRQRREVQYDSITESRPDTIAHQRAI